MKNYIFIETSYLCSLYNKKDVNNTKAIQIFNQLSSKNTDISTGSHIIMEAATILSQRVGKKQGVMVIDELRSGAYNLIHPSEHDLLQAEDLLRAIPSKNVSYADCISFVIMEQHNIQWVLSFDIHFKKQGFKRVGIDGIPK